MKRSETNIRTDRLWLRQIDETDAESIVSLRSDEDVYKFFLNPVKITVEEHLDWYKYTFCNYDDRIDWIAVDDVLGSFVGVYGAKRENNTVELSYISSPLFKQKGYAKEAVTAIMLWCIEHWSAEQFSVSIHRDNVASLIFAKKLGFKACDEADECQFIRMHIGKSDVVGIENAFDKELSEISHGKDDNRKNSWFRSGFTTLKIAVNGIGAKLHVFEFPNVAYVLASMVFFSLTLYLTGTYSKGGRDSKTIIHVSDLILILALLYFMVASLVFVTKYFKGRFRNLTYFSDRPFYLIDSVDRIWKHSEGDTYVGLP